MKSVMDEAQGIQETVGSVLSGHRAQTGQEVDSAVAAVICVESDIRFLPDTLNAVLAQRTLPGIIVIADCTGETKTSVRSAFRLATPVYGSYDDEHASMVHDVDIQIVSAEGATTFGDAVRRALDHAHLTAAIRALWLLHDDSRPADDSCLDTMREAWRNAPTASVLGCKQISWEGDHLHNVGYYATRRHGIASLVVDGEPDQEQYDARQDVYAVDLAGALVSLQTWMELNGTSPQMGTIAESADFCRRVCLSGGRVLIVPRSVIRHRRARFEGLRTHTGHSTGSHASINPYAMKADARERYRFTDIRGIMWLPTWLLRFLMSFILAFTQLARKRPYEALCELGAPWRTLLWMPRGVSARGKVARQSSMSLRQLSVLVARRDQLAQWRERSSAFADSQGTTLLSPLALAHLRAQRRRRTLWVSIMMILSLIAGILANISVLTSLTSGTSFHSATLVPSSASLAQIAEAATGVFTYANGPGTTAPPAPFLLILMALTTIAFGHVTVAMALIILLAAPFSALSFWALAGIFTRSNSVRVATGLLWCMLGGMLGLYSQGNLPMLMVMVFLPAGMAFVFRAVGMYHTEAVLTPTASVQSAGLASLCLAVVVASEPQLVLPLVVVFLAFLIMVRSHRVMLLLIPVPGAFLLAPTLLNVVLNLNSGSYRQLFADMMLPESSVNGSVRASNLLGILGETLGVAPTANSSIWAMLRVPESAAVLATMILVVAAAVVALFLPFALRASRMMWTIGLMGALTAIVAVRVAVAPGQDGPIAGTALPGVAFMMVGMFSCLCIVAGRAVRPFSPLLVRDGDDSAAHIESRHRSFYGRRNLIIVARATLVVLLAACLGLWGSICGVRVQQGAHLNVQNHELPLIAQDYLAANPGHRILALDAESSTAVDYSYMRSGRGDFIDNSPAVNARAVSQPLDQTAEKVSKAAASLLQNNDDSAVATLASLGIGGIYVPYSDDSANRDLVANILASGGTQSVVSNEAGTYVRLTTASGDDISMDTSAESRALSDGWRLAWVWCMGVVVVLYCIVAFPRFRRTNINGGQA
ncbi:glycosyltransferase family 2 protein [Bifidobacterium tissieri]|uniref:Glycosyltransferase family 2 protein n=1 Tax=Bifidobacterium tissieri TaxID=1630162 RepID=A0A5N0A119_9BIFI|nr:glycosyltransferase family 2 protein [Bifidobacterium tissieri]KAA8830820.1 glycosyltransferase family 2 protein [Bifidobacterium tissieri]KAA8832832.1 glycosyltransferase family 2 protein [Bifidobacterium tissieri]